MKIKLDRRAIEVNVRKVSFIRRYIGLMFKSPDTENLMFSFNSCRNAAIHSCFVFFPFLAIWLDDNHEVVDFEVVKPFRLLIKPKKPATKLLEVPLNRKNKRVLAFFVDE